MTTLFDIAKIKSNREYAADHIRGHDFLYEKAAEHMLDSLSDIKRDFKDILIIGRLGSEFIKSKFQNKNIVVFDVGDNLNEIPEFDNGSFDCVLCLHYLHGVNDVPAFLLHVKSILKPDGLFLCSFFGGQSLQELRDAITAAELEVTGGVSQHIHPMIDHFQMAALMQRTGFGLPVVDYDRVIVQYSKLQTLYDDLKCMGEGNALTGREHGIKDLKQSIESHYKNRFYDDGYVATFDIIHAIGWAPHESQQQPAQRGSGQVSLTEIL